MAQNIFNRNQLAQGVIGAYRIIKPGTVDGAVAVASAATDALMGVNESVSPNDGERCDIVKAGIADVIYGGTVVRGDPLTSDANGAAVKAAPAAGSNVRIIGFAEVSAVAGDIGPAWLAPGVMQG